MSRKWQKEGKLVLQLLNYNIFLVFLIIIVKLNGIIIII